MNGQFQLLKCFERTKKERAWFFSVRVKHESGYRRSNSVYILSREETNHGKDAGARDRGIDVKIERRFANEVAS